MKVVHFACGPAATESERKALEHLRTRLGSILGADTWILLTNLAFSVTHQLQSDEIDIVAIGPPGVRVIEVKHWTPQWVEANELLVAQEAERATNKARKVGTTLRKVVPELGRVDAAILLTREPSRGRRLAEKLAGSVGLSSKAKKLVRGVGLYTLHQWKDAVGFDQGSSPVLRPPRVKMLARFLEPRSGVALDGSLRRFSGYVNLELRTLRTERFHRIYAGTHSIRQDRVLLHLYDLSAGDAANTEARARREFEALRRLQLHDWVPRILDSYQDAPGYAAEMRFFTVVDPTAPSMEERASDESWATPARLGFARASVRALKELHGSSEDEALVHRNLTPRTVLVRHDGAPIFTDFQLARIPSDVSISPSEPPPDGWGPEVAPEIRANGLHAAGQRSDLYSLCVCLTRLFRGRDDETSRQVVDALETGLADDPQARSELEDLESTLAELLGESPPKSLSPPVRFWTEEQEVRFQGWDYRVVARLGSGGVGTTFKVVKIDRATKEDRGTYVAKVAHDQDAGHRTVSAYGLAHSYLVGHPALSTIFQVAPNWRENEFTALMAWIAGAPLRDFMGVFPLLAEEQDEASSEALALRWLTTMCDALDVLHRNGLVHGDVSPGNMIVSGSDLVLTDYDFVGKIGQETSDSGTRIYCSPSREEDRVASPADDFYALAASLFHVIFEKEPFRYAGDVAKERGLNWDGVERAEYATLADFLDRATHRDADRRFASAREALDAIRVSSPADVPYVPSTEAGQVRSWESPADSVTDTRSNTKIERREEDVEWLRSLLQSYPGSQRGNRETRGLDSDFAEQTYVETRLEETLYRDLVERRVRLVVLCGNAGDGKTALLQHLAGRLRIGKRTSSERILEGRTEDGLAIRMHLDGSASWQGKSADVLLDAFLEPFQDGAPDDDIARLLAINDGRLLEWIERQETPLTRALFDRLYATPVDESEAGAEAAAHIRFISLNRRSLVGGITPDGKDVETTFLERLVDRLYGGDGAPDIWAPCQTCSAQDRCEVFRATRMFAPEGVPGEPAPVRRRARERLFAALQAVHLRGETHITVRELRAALVYILFGIHDCSDYHAGPDGSGLGCPQSYSDRAFSPESPERQGEVLRELVRFDPALEAHPQIDRYLLRSPSTDAPRNSPRHHGLPLASARRRAYFEWTTEDIEGLAPDDPDALDLARGRHLRQFRDLAITNAGKRDDLTARLCRGISRLEALPPRALDRPSVVPLRIPPRTPTETEFWVEKPLGDFSLEADVSGVGEGLDRLHRQVCLIYRYRDGNKERLRLGAELFHLLLELSDGYQLGDDSTDDTFAHLSIFVQRLVREDHRQLYAWNPMRESMVHEVSARSKDADSKPRQALVMAPLGEESDAE